MAVLHLLGSGFATAAGADPVPWIVQWNGKSPDPDLDKQTGTGLGELGEVIVKVLQGQGGLISNQKDFAALWKKWRKDEEAPLVDFRNHFVVAVTMNSFKTSIIRLNMDDDGNASVIAAYNPSGKKSPGFGYSIAVFQRDKVKTFGGTEIPLGK